MKILIKGVIYFILLLTASPNLFKKSYKISLFLSF